MPVAATQCSDVFIAAANNKIINQRLSVINELRRDTTINSVTRGYDFSHHIKYEQQSGNCDECCFFVAPIGFCHLLAWCNFIIGVMIISEFQFHV